MLSTFQRIFVLLVLVLQGCFGSGNCRSSRERDLLAMLPADVRDLWWTPQLALTLQDINAFTEQLMQGSLATPYQQIRETLRLQLGFDPLRIEELSRVGLNPHQGAVSFRMAHSQAPLLLLPIQDGRLWHQTLTTLLERLDGATMHKTTPFQRLTIESRGRPFGQEMVPSAHWALLDHYMVLVRGSDEQALQQFLSQLAPQPQGGRLDESPAFLQALQHIPTGSLMAFVHFDTWLEPLATPAKLQEAPPSQAPQDSTQDLSNPVRPSPNMHHWLATSVQWRATGMQAISYAPITTSQPSHLQRQEGLPQALAGMDSNTMLYAFARSMGSDNFAQLANYPWLYQLINQAIAPLEAQAGLDFTKDILPHIQGDWTLAMQLQQATSTQHVLQGLWQGLSPWAQLTRLHVTAQVEQAEQFLPRLQQLQQRCLRKHIPIEAFPLQQDTLTGQLYVPIPPPNKNPQQLKDQGKDHRPPSLEPWAVSNLLLQQSAWALVGQQFFYTSRSQDLPLLLRQHLPKLHDPIPGYPNHLLASTPPNQGFDPSPLARDSLQKSNSLVLVLRSESIARWLMAQLPGPAKTPLQQGLAHLQQILLRLQDIVVEVEENPTGMRMIVTEVLR